MLTLMEPLLSLSSVLNAPKRHKNKRNHFLVIQHNTVLCNDSQRKKTVRKGSRLGSSCTLTAHGVEPDQAANVVVKVHVAVFITVSADDHLEELLIQGEACRDRQDAELTAQSQHTLSGAALEGKHLKSKSDSRYTCHYGQNHLQSLF